jgi:hypothetical protein
MARVRFGMAAILVAAWLLSAGSASGDGLPSPVPGVSAGPPASFLQQTATAAGLLCQADLSGFPDETFCLKAGDLVRNATFLGNPALVMSAFAGAPAPLPAAGGSFLAQMTAPFCTPAGDALDVFLSQVDAASSPTGSTYTDPSCRVLYTAHVLNGREVRSVLVFALGAPGILPAATPVESGAATSEPPLGAGTGGGLPSTSTGKAFAASLAKPAEVSTDPVIVAESALLALAMVLLMPFPATLFNSTFAEHYDEVRGWFPRLPAGVGRFWGSWLGVAAFVAISALLYAFLDPGFGPTLESAAEVLGIAIGIGLTAVAFQLPELLAHRGERGTRLRVLPGTIVVGIACVVVSRLTGFLPGYVYGLILGFVFASELSRVQEARRTAAAGALMLGLAAVAWLASAALGDAAADESVVGIVLRTVLAAIVVGGLEGVVFGLLPLRFLQGEVLFGWNRIVWALLFGLGVFAFAHVLVNPASGYLADSTRTPLLTIVALFVGFGVVSLAFWAYFRFRRPREAAPAS